MSSCWDSCCDCRIDTFESNERYIVNDEVWKQAWVGRPRFYREGGGVNVAEILCIGCLEKRIGRTLCRADFEDVPINDPNEFRLSNRFLDRLAATTTEAL